MAALAATGLLLFVLSGCSATTPRFHAPPEEDNIFDPGPDESTAAAAIRTEVNREDDRKIDARKAAASIASGSSADDDTPAGMSRDRVLLTIIEYLGTPYHYGGLSRSGIDCSGFTSVIYASSVNQTLPRSTRDQYRIGTGVSRAKLRFGDLVFFNTTGRRPSHVGIFLENDLFAHASVSDGVTLSSLESTYYRKRFIGARRVLE